MTALPATDHAERAYDAFADHYDLFTAHHDYDGWTATLERLAQDHGLSGRALLDVACGTGKSLLPFARRGYAVTACDVSAEMVRRAAAKVDGDVRLEVADMRSLPRLGAFDLVTVLDDAINYLMSEEELAAAFAGLARNLAPDGVLVFDVNTLRTYRTFFGDLVVAPSDDRVAVWRGGTPGTLAEGGTASSTLELYGRDDGGTWSVRVSLHHQRHHPRATLEAALAGAGLACAGVYGMQLDGDVAPGFDELENSKAVYIARHRARVGERG